MGCHSRQRSGEHKVSFDPAAIRSNHTDSKLRLLTSLCAWQQQFLNPCFHVHLFCRGHHRAAVLSLCMSARDQLISSCYDKHVRVMDLRTPVSVQQFHQHHSRPVLSVAATDRVVYSGSEDKTLCVFDLRARGLLQKLQVMIRNLMSYAQCHV